MSATMPERTRCSPGSALSIELGGLGTRENVWFSGTAARGRNLTTGTGVFSASDTHNSSSNSSFFPREIWDILFKTPHEGLWQNDSLNVPDLESQVSPQAPFPLHIEVFLVILHPTGVKTLTVAEKRAQKNLSTLKPAYQGIGFWSARSPQMNKTLRLPHATVKLKKLLVEIDLAVLGVKRNSLVCHSPEPQLGVTGDVEDWVGTLLHQKPFRKGQTEWAVLAHVDREALQRNITEADAIGPDHSVAAEFGEGINHDGPRSLSALKPAGA
jgi:hypothetical protein